MRRVLCVAEKPSIAKSITQILSGGQFATHNSRNTYIKNYEFTYPQTQSFFVVTSVIGHLMESDFDEAYRNWNSCDPFQLFDAGIQTRVAKDKESIEKNLQEQARRSDMLMIWTDCDREGEHIGMEVARTCRKTKPTIEVKRARFSAIIAQQIHNAAQHPVELDRAQAEAVEARILLDLRIGAAFTRLQTLTLRQRIPQEDQGVISYGPCQFPTLGFVVQRFRQVKDFQPESFWYIYLSLHHPDMPEGEETAFTWKRVHLFDEHVAVAIYEQVVQNCVATVTKVVNKSTKKWKPLPLTTVELQKAGSRLLKMAPKTILDTAEKLYQQGFLSYPRTETDQYDDQFDFKTLINKQTADTAWGDFATKLCQQEGEFNRPRKGKNNDKAHPPIHPTAHANNLTGKEKAVYDYITRRFLASCSKDAEGWQTTVEVECGGEEFSATGLVVLERNYLEVFPYDKWNGQQLPEFVEGARFNPTTCELRDGQTTKPHLLTEADLVSLMDKNGIGTDATIAQHIQTIVDRQYVIEKQEGATKYLAPSTLGIGLVEGYDHIGLERSLSKPYLRRETERNMVQICERRKSKNDVLDQTIDQYKQMFVIARREFGTISDTVVRYINGPGDDGGAPMAVDGGNNGGGGGGGRGGRGGRRGDGGGAPRGPGGGGGGGNGGSGTSANAGAPSDENEFNPFNNSFPSNSKRGRGGTTRGKGRGATKAGSRKASGPTPSFDNPPPPVAKPPPIASSSRTTSSSIAVPPLLVPSFLNNGSPTIPAKRSFSGRQEADSDEKNYKCICQLDALKLTVTKENDNKGRKFWTCSKPREEKCSFFQWDDEPPRTTTTSAPAGPSSTRPVSGTCFKCNQPGHWATNCPNEQAKAPVSRADSFSKTGMCYKCNQEGHWAADCPGPGSGRGFSSTLPGARKRGRGRSSTTSSSTRGSRRGKGGTGSRGKFAEAH